MDSFQNFDFKNFDYNNCSTNVRHGLRSWVDHNQSFLLRWRLTVTASQFNIISAVVFFALVMLGPRLWIILRAYTVWLLKKLNHYRPKFKSDSASRIKDKDDSEMQTIPKYDVEPGARLRSSRVLGRESRSHENQTSESTHVIKSNHSRLAERIKRGMIISVLKVLDVFFSLGSSIVLIFFFVLLTMDFVHFFEGQGHETKTHVIADSPACEYVPRYDRWDPLSLTSSKKMDLCRPIGSHLAYNSEHRRRIENTSCPFDDDACKSPIISGHSGKINLRELGINTPEDYSMQINAKCGTIELKEELNVPQSNLTLFHLLPDSFKSCGDPDHIISRDSPNPYTEILGLQMPIFERMLVPLETWRSKLTFISTWESCPQILENEERRKSSQLSNIVTIATIRHNPDISRNSSGLAEWANKAFACYHQAEFYSYNNNSRIERGFKPETLRTIYSQVFPPRDSPIDPSDLAESLVRVALAEFDNALNPVGLLSYTGQVDSADHNLDEQFNEYTLKYYVKHSLLRGLHTIPEILRDLARNSSLGNGTETSIPISYREMCTMIKFSSNEWSNIYIVPYSGMLVCSILIAVGSITTHDGRLVAAVILQAIWPVVQLLIPEELLVLKMVLQKMTAWVWLVSATISWKLMAYYRKRRGYSKVRLG